MNTSFELTDSTVKLTADDFQYTYKAKKQKYLPFWWPPLLLAITIFIFCMVLLSFNSLPAALTTRNEQHTPDRFIGERAQAINNRLTALGPKAVGSDANEVAAIQLLRDEFDRIRLAASDAHRLELDVQTAASGSFPIMATTSVYRAVQNVVVRLSPANRSTEPLKSLLINSHFDTVSVSPGAGDSGTMIAVMLEVLRVLSASSQNEFEHSIVFLFNGAEENGLQAAHQFVTQHKWARNIGGYINLDSAGSGGRDMLFQVTPNSPWLMEYYKRVCPNPFATTLGQEMFEAGLMPSDTDFRVFRDFGGIPGVDIATGKNGYVYHTRYDTADIVPAGTYQNIGENVLALTKALANAKELNDPKSHEAASAVYFDYLGWFLISYTATEGIIINVIVSLVVLIGVVLSLRSFALSLGIPYRSMRNQFLIILLLQLVSIALGILLLLLLALIYDAAHRSLSWFASPWLLFGIYLCPLYFCLMLGPAVYILVYRMRIARMVEAAKAVDDESEPSMLLRSHQIQLFLHAQSVLMVVCVIVLTAIGIKSAFMFTIPLVFVAASTFINVLFKIQLTQRCWMIAHLTGQLFPFMFHCYVTIVLMVGFLPMQGRTGPAANPEYTVAVICLLLGLLLGGLLVPHLFMLKRTIWIWLGVVGIYVIFIILMVTPLGFPYRAETSPQRQVVYHTERTFYNFNGTTRRHDAGYLMWAMDRNGMDYLQDEVPNLEGTIKTAAFCADEMLCGLPIYRSREFGQISVSNWLPSDEPIFPEQTTLTLESTEELYAAQIRFHFVITGSDHMTLQMSPVKRARIVNWSLNERVLPTGILFGERQTYFAVVHRGGTESSPFKFSVDIENPNWSGVAIDIALTSHYIHHDGIQTPEFRAFLLSFPEFTTVTPYMSNFQSWQF